MPTPDCALFSVCTDHLHDGRNMLIKLAIYQLRKSSMVKDRLQRTKAINWENSRNRGKSSTSKSTRYCTWVRIICYLNTQSGAVTDPFWRGTESCSRSKAQHESKSCCFKRGKYNIGITGCKIQNHLVYLALWRSQLDYVPSFHKHSRKIQTKCTDSKEKSESSKKCSVRKDDRIWLIQHQEKKIQARPCDDLKYLKSY